MKTVLLTENDEDMLELIQVVLSDSGYNLVTATDGEKAVKKCLELKPDLVLMDIKLPNMDGFTAARTLRSKGYDKPIVILTGSDREEDRKNAEKAGCDEYVLKTMDMIEMKNALDRHLAEAGEGLI